MGIFNTINEWIGAPLGYIMYLLYSLVKNYALALLLFTVITKVILLPLSIKQQKSTAKMAAFKPRMDEIQAKYKSNPTKMNEETQKLYQEEGYSPFSGCLPMLIQFPILFGLIDVIYKPLTHILRPGAEIIAQLTTIATDLGVKMTGYAPQIQVLNAIKTDPTAFVSKGISPDFVKSVENFQFSLGPIDLGAKPELLPGTMEIPAYLLLLLIPILSGVTSYLVSKISMKNTSAGVGDNGAMKSMNLTMTLMMPLMSAWIALAVPAGVGIYWIMSNVLMAVQSALLFKYFNPQEMAAKAMAEMEERRENARQERIQAKAAVKETAGDSVLLEKAMTQKERNRQRLAEARKRDALRYGEDYVEVTDEDLK